jgi:PmbA protein
MSVTIEDSPKGTQVSCDDLKQIAVDVVRQAMQGGATAAEAVAADGSEFSATVRLGEVETLKEAGSKGIGVRVFRGQRAAITSSSDLSPEGLRAMVDAALHLSKVTSEDPMAGIPAPEQQGKLEGDLQLYNDDVYSLSTADRIDYARRAEKAAMAADSRIGNSDGGTFDAAIGYRVLANSNGFVGDSRRSYCSLSAVPIAQIEGSAMQRDYWYSVAMTLKKLESPEHVGEVAARRTLRRLGARKVKTAKVPIVFENTVSGSLIGHIFEAVNGDAVYRGASYLADKLGEKIAGDNVNIVDDGTLPGLFGTSAFDSEGVASRKTIVVENGVLKSYLLNTYTARKLGMQTTGNASRGLAGTPGIGPGNFFLKPGAKSLQEIIAGIKEGLFVTEFLGQGVNIVTGDYSRGASGIWIENGELTYPVEEVTVAGNLKDMFSNISEIGNDLEFRSSIASAALRIDGMTVAGE